MHTVMDQLLLNVNPPQDPPPSDKVAIHWDATIQAVVVENSDGVLSPLATIALGNTAAYVNVDQDWTSPQVFQSSVQVNGYINFAELTSFVGACTFYYEGGIAERHRAALLIPAVSTTPASAGATGVTGTICWDTSYVYVCVATNTWKRTAIATWP